MQPTPAAAADSFSDISNSKFKAAIEWLVASGITAGCGGTEFCPLGVVTRGQMASFLVRFLGLPPSTTDHFADDNGTTHEAAINSLADSGITGGCGTGAFCPSGTVTRAQMASFLARALGLSHGGAADLFDDDDADSHVVNIERLAVSGITSGCGTRRFCPGAPVTREQMAAFLRRAHNYRNAAAFSGEQSVSTTVRAPIGQVTGYSYSSDFASVTGSATLMSATPTVLSADRFATIRGVAHYRIVGSGLSGLWVPSVGANLLRSGEPLPPCRVADVATPFRSYSDWQRTLVDPFFTVTRSYAPGDLVPVGNAGVRYGTYGVVHARSLMMTDLRALNDAARAAGHSSLIINSAYRSYDNQAQKFARYTEREGYAAALKYSNRAGHSAHQLGTTLDVNVYASSGLISWMRANAHKYGFIQSYPAGKNAKHCYGTEEWHFRYFGRQVAGQIRASGLSEREWLWYVKHQ